MGLVVESDRNTRPVKILAGACLSEEVAVMKAGVVALLLAGEDMECIEPLRDGGRCSTSDMVVAVFQVEWRGLVGLWSRPGVPGVARGMSYPATTRAILIVAGQILATNIGSVDSIGTGAYHQPCMVRLCCV